MLLFDSDNPVVKLCAAGMQVDGEPDKALVLFEQAWAARRDDFDASIAAHFVARHQPTPYAALEWNERALEHALALDGDRAAPLLPSLHLNVAESYRTTGRPDQAEAHARAGLRALEHLSGADGYYQFVKAGLDRLLLRLGEPAT